MHWSRYMCIEARLECFDGKFQTIDSLEHSATLLDWKLICAGIDLSIAGYESLNQISLE